MDALAAAVALMGAPSMVLTSDAHDLARLVEAGQVPHAVELVGI